ncbi:MAG: sugar phosphate isomerase/epimerase family protein [Gemmataceae bacterium]
MQMPMSRRTLLAAGGLALAAGTTHAKEDPPKKTGFRFCLNTSTIRDNGKPRPLVELIEVTSKAGYGAIEPWIVELDEFRKKEKLADAKKRIADAGLVVPDAIGFCEWIVDDPARRKKGLEQAKRDMDLVQQIGGLRLAAPPVGATGGASQRDDPKASQNSLDLLAAADRYRALLDLGKTMGITPIVEHWGFSKNLSRLGEAVLIATECGAMGGGILPDVYHLYKGGSDFNGLKLISSNAVGIFHVNDYPKIDRVKIVDADRVYPGDGIAPLKEIFATLQQNGYTDFLSLELFNRDYWKQDPLVVAKTGLEKLKAVIG